MGQTLWPYSSLPLNLGYLWVGVGKETAVHYGKSHTGCAKSKGEKFSYEKIKKI